MSRQAALPDDVRVLGLTSVLAGPFCTYHRVLLGGDVVESGRPASAEPPQAGASTKDH